MNETTDSNQAARRNAARRAMVVLVAGVLGLAGCLERELRPLNPCTLSGVSRVIAVDNVENVDLLFMIDNSGSMEEEQASLASEVPRLMRVLTSGVNGDEEFTPVKSLRVGVITSDMGTGPGGVCAGTSGQFGDDGVLLTAGNTATGCMASYPTWLSFEAEGTQTPEQFADDVNCVASVGLNGCGFEQQLEAILKALSPSGSGIQFSGGTVGHGDGQNSGFVRENSLLAIIALTDEDDCSVSDLGLFVQENPAYNPNLNLRCHYHKEALHPVSRYTNGLLALRADNPDLLIYATITGVPTELVPDSELSGDALVAALDDLLAQPAMQEQPDPAQSNQFLVPACQVEGRGKADPPIRMVTLARDLEAANANGVVQSICQEDFSGALDAIIAKIADVLGGACLPRPLTRNSDREVECDVIEVVDPSVVPDGCAGIPGRVSDEDNPTVDPDPDDDDTTEFFRCIVDQVVVDAGGVLRDGQGWYYDDFSEDVIGSCEDTPQRISFTDGASPRNGSIIRLECLQSVQGSGDNIGVGTDCSSDNGICASAAAAVLEAFPMGLSCDNTNTNTCRPTCVNPSDCPGGFTCYDADGDEGPAPAYCINPTCN